MRCKRPLVEAHNSRRIGGTSPWRRDSTINRDSQAYWNRRGDVHEDATSDYERWLMDLLALEAGEEIST